MRSVTAQYRASYTDYDGLATYRVMPTRNVPIDALEPFIFLNHHGPQQYPPGNDGLPFGAHPHKGFETVTFVLDGDVVHRDSTGYVSTIGAGGIQWMTAGRGIIHAENSSEEFKSAGGNLEILQLWVNLPARLKGAEPDYKGLQVESIPIIALDEGRVRVHAVSGSWFGEEAPVQSLSDVHTAWMELDKSGTVDLTIAADRIILFYVIRGEVVVNNEPASSFELVEFGNDGDGLTITANEQSIILIGHAAPNGEPVVAHGPFVMNTMEEITQAYKDYQGGKFGSWGK